jgi:hypothetical protein
MSATNCPLCSWPDEGDGCGHCQADDYVDTDAVKRRIAQIERAATKMRGDVELVKKAKRVPWSTAEPLPCTVLQEKVTAALQEYLATIGANGETTLEVLTIHAGDEYDISRFSVETRFDEPIVRRLP